MDTCRKDKRCKLSNFKVTAKTTNQTSHQRNMFLLEETARSETHTDDRYFQNLRFVSLFLIIFKDFYNDFFSISTVQNATGQLSGFSNRKVATFDLKKKPRCSRYNVHLLICACIGGLQRVRDNDCRACTLSGIRQP